MKKLLNYYGCAHTLDKSDKRLKRFAKQRRERGFDDTETWGLDSTIAEFTLPRLKRFRELVCGHPGSLTMEEWEAILDKMVRAFELVTDDEKGRNLSKGEWKEVDQGLDLFSKWFLHLWW